MLPSDATGGFVYRGYGTGALGVSVEAAGVLLQSQTAGTLEVRWTRWPECGLGGLPVYEPLFLLSRDPCGAVPRVQVRRAALSPGAPVSPIPVQFRRDLDYSFSASVALGVNYTFGTGR